jgi:hypothetical protein
MWAVSAGHRARTNPNGAAMANAVTTAEGDSD